MKGFFKVHTPDEVYEKLNRFRPLSSEEVSLEESLQRVLAEEVVSTINLPEFPRSTVDGFALKAKDTYGASEKNLPGGSFCDPNERKRLLRSRWRKENSP